MHKKLGPLETWQWVAVGVSIAIIYYLYKKYQGNAASNSSLAATAPTDGSATAGTGPIDPTTGIPYAQESGASVASGTGATTGDTTGGNTLQGELSDLASIESLMAGLQSTGVGPSMTNGMVGNAAGDPNAISVFTSAPGFSNVTVKKNSAFWNYYRRVTGKNPPSHISTGNVIYEMFKAGIKVPERLAKGSGTRTEQGGKHNPGHVVNHHPGGRKSAASNTHPAGHTGKTVAPPSHQRAATLSHLTPAKTNPTAPPPRRVSRPAPRPTRRRGP